MYVGELANFVIGSLLVGTAGLVYQNNKTRKGAYLAMAAGTIAMTAGACLINYFFMLPFYIKVMEFPLDAIIGMTQAAGNKLVTDLKSLIPVRLCPLQHPQRHCRLPDRWSNL